MQHILYMWINIERLLYGEVEYIWFCFELVHSQTIKQAKYYLEKYKDAQITYFQKR